MLQASNIKINQKQKSTMIMEVDDDNDDENLISSYDDDSSISDTSTMSEANGLTWDNDHESSSEEEEEDDGMSIDSLLDWDERICAKIRRNCEDFKLVEIENIRGLKAQLYGEALRQNTHVHTLVIYKGDLDLEQELAELEPLLEFVRESPGLQFLVLAKLRNVGLVDLFLHSALTNRYNGLSKIVLERISIRFHSLTTVISHKTIDTLKLHELRLVDFELNGGLGCGGNRAALENAFFENTGLKTFCLRGIDDVDIADLFIESLACSREVKEVVIAFVYTSIQSLSVLVSKNKSVENLSLQSTAFPHYDNNEAGAAARTPLLSEAFRINKRLKKLAFMTLDFNIYSYSVYAAAMLRSSSLEEVAYLGCEFDRLLTRQLQANLRQKELSISRLTIFDCEFEETDAFKVLKDVITSETSTIRRIDSDWNCSASRPCSFIAALQNEATLDTLHLSCISEMSGIEEFCSLIPKLKGLRRLKFSLTEELENELEEYRNFPVHSDASPGFIPPRDIVRAFQQNYCLRKVKIDEIASDDGDQTHTSQIQMYQRKINMFCKRNKYIHKWMEAPASVSTKYFARVVNASLECTECKHDIIFQLLIRNLVV